MSREKLVAESVCELIAYFYGHNLSSFVVVVAVVVVVVVVTWYPNSNSSGVSMTMSSSMDKIHSVEISSYGKNLKKNVKAKIGENCFFLAKF